MDCNNLRVLLINTVYETLDEETAKEVNTHLDECITCRRQVEEARALLNGYREAPKPTPPQTAIAAALTAGRKTRLEIEEKKKTRRIVRDSFLRRFVHSPAIATAALFLIIFTILFYSNDSDQEYSDRIAKGLDRDRTIEAKGEILMPPPEDALLQPTSEKPAKLDVVGEAKPRRANLGVDNNEEKSGITLVDAEEAPPPSKGSTALFSIDASRPAAEVPLEQVRSLPKAMLADARTPELMTSKEYLLKSTMGGDDMSTAEFEEPAKTAPADREVILSDTMAYAAETDTYKAKKSEADKQNNAPALRKKLELNYSLAEAKEVASESGSTVALKRSRRAGAIATPVLTARIWTEQETIAQDMPIVINYEVKNTGTEDVVLWLTGFWPNHRIEVLAQDGKPVAMTEAGKKRLDAFDPRGEKNQDASLSLAPGEADTDLTSYDLREFFQLDNPGAYTVRYLYEEEAPGGWQGQLWSNSLTIQVTE